jgi:hypothetical protein
MLILASPVLSCGRLNDRLSQAGGSHRSCRATRPRHPPRRSWGLDLREDSNGRALHIVVRRPYSSVLVPVFATSFRRPSGRLSYQVWNSSRSSAVGCFLNISNINSSEGTSGFAAPIPSHFPRMKLPCGALCGEHADAYTSFETMNDRGLSLTPADMLKGYLLASITDADKRTRQARSGRGGKLVRLRRPAG